MQSATSWQTAGRTATSSASSSFSGFLSMRSNQLAMTMSPHASRTQAGVVAREEWEGREEGGRWVRSAPLEGTLGTSSAGQQTRAVAKAILKDGSTLRDGQGAQVELLLERLCGRGDDVGTGWVNEKKRRCVHHDRTRHHLQCRRPGEQTP